MSQLAIVQAEQIAALEEAIRHAAEVARAEERERAARIADNYGHGLTDRANSGRCDVRDLYLEAAEDAYRIGRAIRKGSPA